MSAPSTDSPLRRALWPLSLLYGGVAALRNALFATGVKRVHRLPVTVVSVGNLTVGGTGKTPMVAFVCERARRASRSPGVLARGYGRAPGAVLNDEGVLLARRLPWLLQEQDPDRVAAGERLIARGVDFVVLDDGFQHRRLHRDVDLVCLDATLPFGNGHCLPAGELREFRSGLRRADLLVLTRAGRLDEGQRAQRVRRLRQIARRDLPVYFADHAPRELVRRPDGEVVPLGVLRGQPVVLWSAIARPASFRATVERLGAVVLQEIVHPDHHRFTAAEVEAAAHAAEAQGAWLVTTEKDDARLDAFAVSRHVLRIDMEFLGEPPTDRELGL